MSDAGSTLGCMGDLPERMTKSELPVSELRASDADRERVAAVLRDAAGQGRLGLDELDERLAAVYAARTYAELEPVLRDLPGPGVTFMPGMPGEAVHPPARAELAPTRRTAVAVMGGFTLKGPWVVPRQFRALAFWGGGEIDLREAVFAEGEVTIQAVAIMGGIEIIVPEEAEVHVTGIGVMGGFDHRASGAGRPNGPRIVVTGLAFWGGVDVVRRPPEEELRRRKLERKLQRKQARLERRAARQLERRAD
jgi:hypothetical protein